MRPDRRSFCIRGTTTVLGATLGTRFLHAQPAPAQSASLDVAAIDCARVLREADGYLAAQPVTVTASRSSRSPGSAHDFYSEGDYWWPDPEHPGGPYIRRDGFSNPANFTAHREAMVRLSLIVPALTAAWKLTKRRRYAEHAAAHLRAWFIAPETRMNPNLEHAQAIFGVNQGRGIGIIDTIHLVEPVRAAGFLLTAGVFTNKEQSDLRGWFSDYVTWLTTSKNGQDEKAEKNNHGSCWVMQVAEFARFTGNAALTSMCHDRFRATLVPNQIVADGSLPLELARTKPYSYALFDLDILCTIAQIITTADDNFFIFELPDGRGLRRAVAFMFPFIQNKKLWPYKPDVEYFDDLPVRQPSLLFAGLAYRDASYLELWKKLNPDPTVPEIIRNYPIRQPVLWV
jgi:Alginate lyase